MVPNTIARIGAGYWGKNLMRNFHDLAVLSWVCEVEPTNRAHYATVYPTVRFTDSMEQVPRKDVFVEKPHPTECPSKMEAHSTLPAAPAVCRYWPPCSRLVQPYCLAGVHVVPEHHTAILIH